ncbi:MAG TPA: thiamine pyrophosphate-dependent enzyme, partial [Gammaproteobacteria bacterium]|nr:thiamine pyrophosphate-dependent enzyme [Gammaproteobacteria bacterium]
VDSFARAYGIMMTQPFGPVYLCYDAGLQEKALAAKPALTAAAGARVPTPVAAAPSALEEAADLLVAAERPVLMAEYGGARAFAAHVALAETLGAGFVDVGSRLNFPSRHPLNLSLIDEAFAGVDVIAGLDVRDWERVTSRLDRTTRQTKSLVGEHCRWIDIGFGDLEVSAWSMDYQRFRRADLRILGDTATAVPALTELCRERIARDPGAKRRVDAQREHVTALGAAARERWAAKTREVWDDTPISLPRLASELWTLIEREDWVLTSNTLRDWTRRIWDFDAPHRHPGKSLGTATQIGISLGVALAHKGTDRLVVAIEPDGDLMFDPGALWVAAKYELPILIVMFNNRAYYNDWEHQLLMARLRGTPEARAHIGMDLHGPEPDFALLARSMGCVGIGPVLEPGDLHAALAEGIAQVKAGKPVVVDVVTAHR